MGSNLLIHGTKYNEIGDEAGSVHFKQIFYFCHYFALKGQDYVRKKPAVIASPAALIFSLL
jgi:hypothetical protein